MQSRLSACLIAVTILVALPASGAAQSRVRPSRLSVAGWVGDFNKFGGFSQGQDFFQFDDGTLAFGGAAHYGFNSGLSVGLEAVFSSPDYVRYDRDQGDELGTGSADVFGLMANARLYGTPGAITIVATGGFGFFSWDVAELGSRNNDFALQAGIGLEYRALSRVGVFGDYTWWWIYHDKDDTVVTNTVRNNAFRGGIRLILF